MENIKKISLLKLFELKKNEKNINCFSQFSI